MADESQPGAPDVGDLLARVRSLEDRLEIQQIVMTHPPSADSGDPEYWRVVLGETGRVDYADNEANRAIGLAGAVTAEQLAAMTSSPQHAAIRSTGLAHFATAPIVAVNGDRAEAWNYHQTLIRQNHDYVVFNVFANHWMLARTAEGWRVTVRKVRLMDGNEAAQDILRSAVAFSTAHLGRLESG